MEWTLARSTPDLEPSQALLTLSPPSVWCKRRGSASASVARALGSNLAPQILSILLAHWLSVSASTTCSTAVGQPPGVRSHPASMTPPSIGSTVGHHQGCGPGPAVLGVPSVSSLAPPSVAPWSLSSGPLLGVHPPPEAPPKLPPRAERLIAFAIISRYEKIRFLNRRGCSYTVT